MLPSSPLVEVARVSGRTDPQPIFFELRFEILEGDPVTLIG